MPLTARQLQDAYLAAWVRGQAAFGATATSMDVEAVDQLADQLDAAPDVAGDEQAHPLDRLDAQGLLDGWDSARRGYAEAAKRAPWAALTPKGTSAT